MKTAIVRIKHKISLQNEMACGICFSILEQQDVFCWSCGMKLENGVDMVDDYEALRKYNEFEKVKPQV